MAKKQFKAESKRLLDLMINSIYTHKEIFLREIISNASDACDKLCYQALTDDSVKLTRKDFKIDLSVNKDARTITVTDNGIGMDKEDLENNLGVIASSGSLRFRQEMDGEAAADTDIIGQFGVGFYSAFMVAKEVLVVSRAFGSDEAWARVSDGVEGYTIEEAERTTNSTDIILTLKDDTDEEKYDTYLSEWGLKSLIKKYSNYVRYPITMDCDKTREKPKPEDAGDDYKPEYEDYQELETVNSMTPIWKKRSSDVEQKDYDEFYKSTFH